MWRNPKYYLTATATDEPAPPEPAGETVFEAYRNRGTERLRMSWEEYQGHQFVRLQVGARNASGAWWPVRGKCVTVKLREVDDLVEALQRTEGLVDHEAPGPHQGCARAASTSGAGGVGRPLSGPRSSEGGRNSRRPTLPLGNSNDPALGPRPGGRPSHAQPSPGVDPQRQRPDARGATPQPPWAAGQSEAFDEFQDGGNSN